MSFEINSNAQKLITPIELAIRRFAAKENSNRLARELEMALRELISIDEEIIKAEDELFGAENHFTAFLTTYEIDDYMGRPEEFKLYESGPIESVQVLVDEYSDLVKTTKTLSRMNVKLSLNGNLFTLDINTTDKEGGTL